MTFRDRYYAYPKLREFAFLFPPLFGWRKAAVQAILQHLPPAPQTLLEVGCATGMLTRRLAHRLPTTHIVAIDASAAMIQIARRASLPHTFYFHRRLEEMTGTFDVVVSLHVFPLLPLGPALGKVYDLLAPQGIALLTFTSSRLLTRLHQRFFEKVAGDPITLYPPSVARNTARHLGFVAHVVPIHPLEGSYLLVLKK